MPQEKMEIDVARDIQAIREWIDKQPHLPKNLDNLVLSRFLHSCHHSLERTKKCIDQFFTMRSSMQEIFTQRDPIAPEIKVAYSITKFCCMPFKDNQLITIYHMTDCEKLVFNDCGKTFFMQMDVWMMEDTFMEEADIIILDLKDLVLKVITKVNITLLRKSIVYLLEAAPLRMKEIHLINCPPFVDKLFALVKPILSSDILNMIHFHQSNSNTLYKYVDKEYLPIEYGGKGEKIETLMANWIKRIEQRRDFFLDNKMWLADETKMKKSDTEMNGSFRTLSID